jgi:hypothetical protein
VVDAQGHIAVRVTADGTQLPQLSLSCPNVPLLLWLGDLTGVRPVVTTRAYSKMGCAEHCATKHRHVTSTSGRWQISGAKATVVLAAIGPFLRWQVDEATAALELGLSAPFKPATPNKMEALGWPIPPGLTRLPETISEEQTA